MVRRTFVLAAVAVVLAGGACGVERPAGRAAAPPATVTVSAATCGADWKPPAAGRRSITAHNASTRPATLALIGSDQERVIIDPQPLAGHGTNTLRFVIAPGTYAWRCRVGSGPPRTGELFTVTGDGVSSFETADPPTPQELADAVDAYRPVVAAGISQLARDTDALSAAVGRSDLGAARTRWLTAHLDYLRLGAAYGTFGDHDRAIDGTPEGLAGGRADPRFVGFHRLELGLWGGEAASTLTPIADALDDEVHALAADFPTEVTPPVDLPLRAHEILENGMQFDLTGRHDFGSNSDLASVRAEVDATAAVITALTPALTAHAPTILASTTAGLDRLRADLDGLRAADGTWPPLSTLSPAQREHLDGATADALERLSHLPVALEQLGDGD